MTIGTALPDEKLNPEDMRGKDTILEDEDAVKYRKFIGIFSRDKLLPYFKNQRAEFIKLGAGISSGRDVAFGEFFAWYYNAMANAVAETLAAEPAHHAAGKALYLRGQSSAVSSRVANNSKIEWTDATWNPVRGCTKISPGCAHCYAETFAERFRGVPGTPL